MEPGRALIENAEKKLRETSSSLEQMIELQRMAFGDKEKFDFYLSGFLSAGMSVRGAFHIKQDRKRNEAVRKWKDDWEAQLTPEERCLWDFMRTNRNHEVHGSSLSHTMKTEEIKVGIGSSYSDKSGTLEVWGSPMAGPVVIHKPTWYFTIDGVDRKATEACGEYLGLLEKMVAKFKAEHA
jgi:hypothetical protein